MIKVLIVDDSEVARELIEHVLSADPEIEVIGQAHNGADAIAMLAHLRPDVVTMDIQMPGMDGFEATHRIMTEHPIPVIIVTASMDPKTDAANFRVLEAGALAILLKPPGFGHPDHARAAAELVQTVKLMSEVKVVRRSARLESFRLQAQLKEEARSARFRIVAIGASTGGPVVIQRILSSLPGDYPLPLLVVQHMTDEFIGGFAEWLDNSCAIRVKLAVQGEPVCSGTAYVAPGGVEMGVDEGGRITLTPCKAGQFLCPSAGHLFHVMAQRFSRHAVGILLTGMGSDGAQGLKEMQEKGALTIAQDQESCVVFGMPGEAVKLRAAQHVLAPEKIVAMLHAVADRCCSGRE
jgi:two-component system, chemotaxis family, protein-glutamate methylesterase/glutaminase